MNKKYIIIGVVIVIIIAYYLLTKNKKTGDAVQDAINSNTGSLSSLTSANKTAVTDDSISPEDLEYNELVNEYKQKYRRSPDPSWTISQLEKRIEEYDEINDAINQYYAIEGEQSKTEDDLSKMSLQEIQREIQKEQEKIDEANLKKLLDRFVATCLNYGKVSNPAGAAKKTWDQTVFNEILSLSSTNLKKLNNMVGTRKDELYYPENYSALKAYWRKRTSLADAIPTGTMCTYRAGASAAKAFRNEMVKRIK